MIFLFRYVDGIRNGILLPPISWSGSNSHENTNFLGNQATTLDFMHLLHLVCFIFDVCLLLDKQSRFIFKLYLYMFQTLEINGE